MDALAFFKKAPAVTDREAIMAYATSNFHEGSPAETIRLLLGIEEEIEASSNMSEIAHYFKILSFSFGLQKDQIRKEYYMRKASNTYQLLWKNAVTYYTGIAVAGTHIAAEDIPTYSGELRLLHRLLRKAGHIEEKSELSAKLASYDVFRLRMLKQTAKVSVKLCEAYIVLRQRRRFLKEFARLRNSGDGNNYQKVFEAMEA